MVASQISTRTVHPPVGKPWHKGQSGNPGGRPKVAADVKEEARKHTKEALHRLVHWMRSDDPQASIRAAMALLDRGCGKPTQAVEGTRTEDCVVRWMTADAAVNAGVVCSISQACRSLALRSLNRFDCGLSDQCVKQSLGCGSAPHQFFCVLALTLLTVKGSFPALYLL